MDSAHQDKPRSGFSALYLILTMGAMLAIGSFAVDYGLVQMSKTQLRTATDAAARAAVVALSSASAARTAAKAVATANLINGTGLTLTDADIQVGRWNAGTQVFTNNGTPYNAVRINAQLSAARGTAIPLIFAKVLGRNTCNLTASSTAYLVAAINTTCNIPADSNPWLAGASSGTEANEGSPGDENDEAPDQRPPQMTGITLTEGMALTFDGISGTGSNDPSGATTGPDGNASWIGDNWEGNENGIADLKAPMNCLVGVFLNASTPSGGSGYPPKLDFSTGASRDFLQISPQLRQPFFIGDGKTSGNVQQKFIVPTGATRLILCSMDEYEWNNNSGSRTVQINKPQILSIVD